jgi:mannose-6-phosphate isomerase-like protein (cupin superfamily)
MDRAPQQRSVDAHEAVAVEAVPITPVGTGSTRRDLPAPPGVRVWVVDISPGTQWPHVDHHDTGEGYYVVSGEVIEGEHRYPAGTCVSFAPGSHHRPRTERGARLFGFNPVAASAPGAAP